MTTTAANAWASAADALAAWTFEHLVNRTDVYGKYLSLNARSEGSSITMPARKDRAKVFLTQHVIARHYRLQRPEQTVGLHSTNSDDTSRWLAFDVDLHVADDASQKSAANLEVARRLAGWLVARGFAVRIEDSNGTGGYHVWCLFAARVSSKSIYSLGRRALQELGLLGTVEVFPKQPSVGKGFGNWLRLPGRHHDGRAHWSRFLDGDRWVEGAEAVKHWLATPLNDPALLSVNDSDDEGEKGRPTLAAERRAAVRLLKRLSADRAENYDAWIAVGQALHAVDPSARMLREWEAWSRTSAKFTDGTCAEKWAGFRADGGRNTRSLEAWADEDDPPKEKRGKRSQAQDCYDLVTEEGCELWHSRDQSAFATIPKADHAEHVLLKSRAFKMWLYSAFQRAHGKVLGSGALNDALNALEAYAVERGALHEVFVRVGRVADTIYLDLGDETWRVVEVTADGWQLISSPPIRFFRPSTLLPLPVPIPGGTIESLRDLGNFGDPDNFVLFVGWILAALRGRKPYPILIMEGEQGSAKSTHTRIARECVDPSTSPMRAQPDDERSLAIAALHNHVLAFDNLSRIASWLSDALCRVATGGGFGTRRLYTDQDEVVFDHARPVIVNGITELATRPDLRDRSFVLNLPAIDPSERRTEDDVWRRVAVALPGVLGALCDAMVVALRDFSKVQLGYLPRMADVARWVTAAEPSLAWPPGTFVAAHRRNQKAATVYAVDHDSVAWAICRIARDHQTWTGTATGLLDLMNAVVNQTTQFSSDWPRSPRQLADRIRRAAPDLREVGILMEFNRGSERRIVITRTEAFVDIEPEEPW